MKFSGKMGAGAGVRRAPQNQKDRPMVRSPKAVGKYNQSK